ncbi:spermatogenesis-associated protein 20 [Drosophila takahashii]|uniref:spermatogenesis-associated protein 20 n=1 Tax=Drosophila takahashii TaxID=29030 RepID=UPI001CF8F693|nr:spermatogenesis-associated protein 20 [Drosophila takahashii]
MFRVRPLLPWIRSSLQTTLKLQTDTSQPESVRRSLRLPHIGCPSRTVSVSNQQQCFRGMATGGEASKEETAKVEEAPKEEVPKQGNRLVASKSPYLLQHAYNPVDWYPWGEEAFEKARSENKLIFLSVGYSTCHWCHVMEHESFENAETAAIMNQNFVNIKVDREERPDIDKVYMQFLLMTKGSGGWPMSVWLTPELAPIVAGTYFPPKSRYGMPSFSAVLNSIAKKWETDKESLVAAGATLIDALQKSQEYAAVAEAGAGSAMDKLAEAISVHKQRFDQSHGGFGGEPKFPEVPRLNFLFHGYLITKDLDVLDMVIDTLDHIGRGGINDHIFGGFARYATTHDWHNVHFEKMLYDQGQLMVAFSHAYKVTRNEAFLDYGDKIYRYLVKDLRHPLGGFYAGEDADSLPSHEAKVKVEGAFYAWTWDEIEAAFKEKAERFDEITPERAFEIYAFHYDLKPRGNIPAYSDPHGHLTHKNILIVRGSEEQTCANFNLEADQFRKLLTTANDILHVLRDQRPRPHLDTKIICAWNGLVLSGLCKLGNCYSAHREQYMQTAKELLEFLRQEMYDPERKLLIRACYGVAVGDETLENNEVQIDGFLDDYAFLIKGLLDYYKATLDVDVLHWARSLQDTQDKLFWDDQNGAYFFSQQDSPNVIVRLKEDHDGAEPCGNSVSARNLVLLGHYYDENAYLQRAGKLLNFFTDVSPFGHALPEMLSARLMHENGLDLVAVVGPDSPDTQRFVEICRKFYIPSMIIVHVDPSKPEEAPDKRLQTKFKMVSGKTTVYICHERACRMPVTDPQQLEENLTSYFFSKRV